MAISTDILYSTAGIQLPKGACVVIVTTEWNAESIAKLETGCKKILDQSNVPYKIITVPGAF
jgi:6,7-dimethyl-8-ribityllumazine synthase